MHRVASLLQHALIGHIRAGRYGKILTLQEIFTKHDMLQYSFFQTSDQLEERKKSQ